MRHDKTFEDHRRRRPIKARRHPNRLPTADLDAEAVKLLWRIRLPSDYLD